MRRALALAIVATGCGSGSAPAAAPPAPAPPAVRVVETPPPPGGPPALKLSRDVAPARVALDLTIVPSSTQFRGKVTIDAQIAAPVDVIWLNATDLMIERAAIDGRAATVVPGDDDFVGLRPGRALRPGPVVIDIDYTGKIDRDKSRGIYAEEEGGEWYAYTFFEAIDARRAFPGFDQPDAKVPWQLTFHVRREHVALANAPVVSETDEPDGMKKVVLAESRPMPSYLVAFVVGPFDVVDGGKAGRADTPVRFVLPRGRRGELRYALSITPRVVAALEEYFAMDYPFGKLDVAVVPRYWGTMEHPGIVAMGQPLTLIPPTEETRGRRSAYTNILAHELAHYWFGDLVTPVWWDDTWLNEALGTWLDAVITDRAEPGWRFLDRRHRRAVAGMAADEKLSTKAIRQPVETKEAIGSAFDASITYYKGDAVLRMFESWVGEVRWRDFLRAYMARHAWKNASADDFLAMMTGSLGADVAAAFQTFLTQPGVPVVEHRLVCDGSPRLELTQRRSLPAGTAEQAARTWHIPVCVRTATGRACVLMTAPAATLSLPGPCPAWVVMNAGPDGYYRARYSAAEVKAMLGRRSPLTMPERSMLLADIEGALGRDELTLADTMPLARLVIADPDERLRASIASLTGPLRRDALDPALQQRYRRWIRKTYGPTARELGWRRRRRDSDDRHALRIAVVPGAAWAGDTRLVAQAQKLARAWLADPSSLDDDIVDAVLATAARTGDANLFHLILTAARTTPDRTRQQRLITALGRFEDPTLAARALDLVVGPTFDFRESRTIVLAQIAAAETRAAAWKFVKSHAGDLLGRLRHDEASWFVGAIAGAFCDEDLVDQARKLFSPRVGKIEGAQYELDQALDTAQQCIAAQARLVPSAAKFLTRD